MKPKPIPLPRMRWRRTPPPVLSAQLVLAILCFLATTALFAQVIAPVLDYGDAPAPYPTKLADDGARHTVSSRIFLGKAIDAELDGFPSTLADGDDSNSANRTDDEDGIVFSSTVFHP